MTMEQMSLDLSDPDEKAKQVVESKERDFESLDEKELVTLYSQMLNGPYGAQFLSKDRLIEGLQRGREKEMNFLRAQAQLEDQDDRRNRR